jgi:hypothetical protein
LDKGAYEETETKRSDIEGQIDMETGKEREIGDRHIEIIDRLV